MTNLNMEIGHAIADEDLESVAGGFTVSGVIKATKNGADTGKAIGTSVAGSTGGVVGTVIGAIAGFVSGITSDD